MKTKPLSYQRPRFPSEIISYAVWLYQRLCLSFHEVEELLAERGITVTYETIRQWCQKFGMDYARKLKKRHGRLGDTWHIDELFITLGCSGRTRPVFGTIRNPAATSSAQGPLPAILSISICRVF